MPAFFLDSSAIVKRYRRERGTDWIRHLTSPDANHEIYVALIAGAEVVAAISRQHREGQLASDDMNDAIRTFQHEFRRLYHVVAITESVIENAMRLAQQHPLRGYDAVQLAAASRIQRMRQALGLEDMRFVSADVTLNTAASEEAFTVENPNERGD